MKKYVVVGLAGLLCLAVAVVAATDNGIRDTVMAFVSDGGTVKEEAITVSAKDLRIWRPDAAAERAASSMTTGMVAPGRGTRLVVGRISDNPRKHWPRLEAMAGYLADELRGRGVDGVDVVIVETVEEMAELFRTGQVDIISETAFQAIELTEQGDSEMLLREWKDGVPVYNSLVFARSDSGIRSIEDLRGRTIVFEDRGSTSGYLMPRAAMARRGLSMIEMDGGFARPARNTVGFGFAGQEDTVVGRVHRGYADAGAIANLDWTDEDEVTPGQKADLTIIYESDPVIRSIVLVRSALDPVMKARIAAVLEGAHESEAGREMLDEYWDVARFDRIEGEAMQGLLNAQVMREVFRGF